MQFTIWTKNKGDADAEAWPEEYSKPVDDPEEWAKDTIKYFNNTLHPGEPERVLVKVVVESNAKPLRIEHSWRKTNLVTLMDMTDRYLCSVCGAKGTRFGLGGPVLADRKKQAQCIETPASRDKTDDFDKQVFASYLRSQERRAKVGKKKEPIVREVVWTKRLRKAVG